MEDDRRLVAGLGELLWDMLPEGRKLGGAPANFAYHAGQFLGPDNVVAISALGQDRLADETVEALDAHSLRYILPRVPYPTGTVQVTLDAAGIPSYEIKEGVAWDNIPPLPEIMQVAANCRAVCFGSLAQRNRVSRDTVRMFLEATPEDCVRIFDINLRQHFYSKEVIEESFRQCNILKINDEELVVVSRMSGLEDKGLEDRCRALMDSYGIGILVLTCGTDGSYVFTPGEVSFLETPKVKVADTVGAGDSFTGAFCAALLEGRSIKDAHRRAVDVSAYVCTCAGAMPPIPEEYQKG